MRMTLRSPIINAFLSFNYNYIPENNASTWYCAMSILAPNIPIHFSIKKFAVCLVRQRSKWFSAAVGILNRRWRRGFELANALNLGCVAQLNIYDYFADHLPFFYVKIIKYTEQSENTIRPEQFIQRRCCGNNVVYYCYCYFFSIWCLGVDK